MNWAEFSITFSKTYDFCIESYPGLTSGVTNTWAIVGNAQVALWLPRWPCPQIDKNILCDIDAVGQLPWLIRLPFYSGYTTGSDLSLSKFLRIQPHPDHQNR